MNTRHPTGMLADACDVFADGDWIESKDQSPAGIRLIQTGNVGFGIFKGRGEKARYVSDATFKRLRCTEIFEGDCLISRLPEPVGRSCILPNTGERMITAVDCTIVRFKPKQVLPKFFNYYSQTHEYLRAVDSGTTGTTRKRISRSKLGQVTIPVPTLPEQQRIVGVLDEAFAAIARSRANDELNLRNVRELFHSRLNAVFTERGEDWRTRPLGDVCDFQRGLTYKKEDEVDLSHNVVLRAMNIDLASHRLDFTDLKYICDQVAIPESKKVKKGSLMICTASGSKAHLGKIAFIDDDYGYAFGGFMGMLTPHGDLVPRYLFHLMTSGAYDDFIGAMAAGMNINNLKFDELKQFQVPCPPRPEQERIVEQLDSLSDETERLSSLYRRKLDALETMKRSLLQQAFAGAL